MKLYEVAREYEALLDESLDDAGFVSTIEALRDIGRDGCVQIGKAIKNQEVLVGALEAEIERLQERSKSIKAKIKRTKVWLLPMVRKFTNDGLIDTPEVTIKINRGRGRVDVNDADSLPREYLRFPAPEPDKLKIYQALNAGEEVTGAELVREEILMVK